MLRRQFLRTSAAVAAGATFYQGAPAWAEPAKKLRVAVIGHTGRGNYGHGLDTVWLRLAEVELVGVADADAAGLAAAQQRLNLGTGFADYRAMLASNRPDLVAVCPRHVDQHCDMTLAAIEAGVKGVYIEKPFVRTPAEADQIVAACTKHGARVAVAHRNRYHPTLVTVERLIADGGIGKVLELRGRGKGDRRGGGEDLWVLGTHVLNLMSHFGGGLKSCSALVKQGGELVTAAHVRAGAEGLGPLAGDEVHARYETVRGPIGYFDSTADDGLRSHGFGLQIVGTEGIIDLKIDRHPLAHLCRGNPFQAPGPARLWVPITTAGVDQPEPRTDLVDYVDRHVGPARDLIAAIATGREPLCGVQEATATVEAVCAVFESHRHGGARVTLPLAERGNPLAKLS